MVVLVYLSIVSVTFTIFRNIKVTIFNSKLPPSSLFVQNKTWYSLKLHIAMCSFGGPQSFCKKGGEGGEFWVGGEGHGPLNLPTIIYDTLFLANEHNTQFSITSVDLQFAQGHELDEILCA